MKEQQKQSFECASVGFICISSKHKTGDDESEMGSREEERSSAEGGRN